MRTWPFLVLLLIPACGDDGGGAIDASVTYDAKPDAEPADAGPLNTAACPSSYGFASVFSTLSVPEDDPVTGPVGFDLTGDNEPDNSLAPIAALLTSTFSEDIEEGTMRTLTELRDLASLGADDSEMSVVIYGGVDGDQPADTADDFAGDEGYYFAHEWVDPADCSPEAVAAGSFSGGTVSVSADTFKFYVSSLGGFVDIERARIEATVEADLAGARTTATGMFGGAITPCALAHATAPLGESAQHALAILGVQPDVDLDGDGLETVQHDSAGIISCTDGDGTTVVMGAQCGCDPRMADGYSITLLFDAVGATILGPDPNAEAAVRP